jgi:hypothetical protein
MLGVFPNLELDNFYAVKIIEGPRFAGGVALRRK